MFASVFSGLFIHKMLNVLLGNNWNNFFFLNRIIINKEELIDFKYKASLIKMIGNRWYFII